LKQESWKNIRKLEKIKKTEGKILTHKRLLR
jgi:hypothetical protein